MTEKTYCRICEAACGLTVARDAAGAPQKLLPDREHPISRGYVCAKGTRFIETATHPSRITAPMKRAPSGALERTSWREALASISQKLRSIRAQYGDHSIGVYFGNPLAFSTLGNIGLISFLKALNTRNVYYAGTQDCQNKFAAAQLIHGSPVIHPIPDLHRAKLAVFFGTNPAVSQCSFVHLEGGAKIFDEMERRGAKLVWVDPRKSESAMRWGRHLPITPGADVWLILALLSLASEGYRQDPYTEGLKELLSFAHRISLEEASSRCGISVEEIQRLSQEIKEAPSTAFHLSVGVNQGPFGTLAYVALQALSYVTGNFDRAGGSLFHPLALWLADLFRLAKIGTDPKQSRVGGFPSVLDALPGGVLADEILTPGRDQIKAMIVVAGDPLVSMPGEAKLREAFGSLELLVSLDLFENQTGRMSHFVLPTTSWLERWDVATTTVTFQQAPLIQWASPVMAPPNEARDELWIFASLLEGLGSLHPVRWLGKLPWARMLPAFGYGLRAPSPKPGRYLGRGPRTPNKKVRFWSEALRRETERLLQSKTNEGGFVLVGRRRRLGHNSWLHHGARDGDAEGYAWLHPEDMQALSLQAGASLELRSAAGVLSLPAQPKEGVARGTIVVPHGVPGLNINALIPSGEEQIEPISGQHVMTGIPIEVRTIVK